MGQNLKIKRFQFEFTRPANTTAYAAQDSVSDNATDNLANIITWVAKDADGGNADNALVRGGSYQIKSAKLTKSDKGVTNATFDLYFYTSGVAATGDNLEMPLLYASKHIRVGKVGFTMATAGTNDSTCAESAQTDVNITFKASGTTIYSKLTATAAYTPVSAEKFYGEIEIIDLNG